MTSLEKKLFELHSLAVFRRLLQDPVISRLCALLGTGGQTKEQIDKYSEFAGELFGKGGNLSQYVLRCVLEDENVYITAISQGKEVSKELEESAKQELRILEETAGITSEDILAAIDYDGYLPKWNTERIDFASAYEKRLHSISTQGYGIFAKYTKFRLRGGEIVPVKSSDPIRLSDFSGYEKQRGMVVSNTLTLLKGKPAANVLLYGDAGTGKSSTVKAIINEYQSKGLRLIEISKRQVSDISVVIEKLRKNPLKFILFIDDLSFSQENDDLYELKAALEGSVSAKSSNVVIYATSNRRHLIKETFTDRQGDDVHRNETMQEMWSLSDRFGLRIGFMAPSKNEYLKIVHELKDMYKVHIDDEELDLLAEQYAISGRSPRVARQFIEHLKSIEGE